MKRGGERGRPRSCIQCLYEDNYARELDLRLDVRDGLSRMKGIFHSNREPHGSQVTLLSITSSRSSRVNLAWVRGPRSVDEGTDCLGLLVDSSDDCERVRVTFSACVRGSVWGSSVSCPKTSLASDGRAEAPLILLGAMRTAGSRNKGAP